MTKRRPYLCPDGSEPCGRNGFCGYCPHDKKAKSRPSSVNATEADALMEEVAECSQKVIEAVTLRSLTGDNDVPSKRNQQDAIGDLRKALKHYQEYVK